MQDNLFLVGEGDQWFTRNREFLANSDPAVDPVLKILGPEITPGHVIEIGASNGYRLHELYLRHGCQVTAVEPSREAIVDGQSKYPEIEFVRGIASQLPAEFKSRFDLAIVNFVLHWIDRSSLMKSVAEIDSVLQENGFLVIGDFHPARPERVAYHHLPGQDLWTYKQSYHELFLATNLYEMIACLSFDHATRAITVDCDPQHRAQVVLLRKTLGNRYATVTLT